MIIQIRNNLSILKEEIYSNLENTIEKKFEKYIKSLEQDHISEVYLAQVYNTSLMNDYLKREIYYLSKFLEKDLNNLLDDLKNSRNTGTIFNFSNVHEFDKITNQLKRNKNLFDISIIKENKKKFKIDPGSIKKFSEALSSLENIEKLNLSFQGLNLSKKDIYNIISSLEKKKYYSIKSLGIDFSNNKNLDDELSELIIDYSLNQKYLHSFVMSFYKSSISTKTLYKLSNLLIKNNDTLHFIRLSLTNLKNIEEEGWIDLVRALSSQKRLLHLELFLGGNKNFDSDILFAFFKNLKILKGLLHLELDFSFCDLTIDRILEILVLCKNFFFVKVLRLYFNGLGINEDIYSRLKNLIDKYKRLEILGIEVIQEKKSVNTKKFLDHLEREMKKKIPLFHLSY